MTRERRYRLTLDFSARLGEVAAAGGVREEDLAARRFVAALLEHPDALDLLLRNHVVNEACVLDPEDVFPVAGVPRRDEEEILEPFLPCIPEAVVEELARWGETPLSAEVLDIVTECVEVRLEAGSLAEITLRAVPPGHPAAEG